MKTVSVVKNEKTLKKNTLVRVTINGRDVAALVLENARTHTTVYNMETQRICRIPVKYPRKPRASKKAVVTEVSPAVEVMETILHASELKTE